MNMLNERWRSTLSGDVNNRTLVDTTRRSVYVGDGWGVAFAALRLRRLDLATGAHLADVRTRHQLTYALAMSDDHLYATTDSRLFELDPAGLTVVRQWGKGLVRYASQLVPAGGLFVIAGWLLPSIGIFDPATGRTRRVRAGSQPLVIAHEGAVKVANGFDGGIATLDPVRGRLSDLQPTVPLWTASAGEHIWAVAAGAPEGGQGKPPVWTRRGTETLIRVTGSGWQTRVSGKVATIFCDDDRQVLWCMLAYPSRLLVAVAQSDGRTVAVYEPPEGFRFHHVSPSAGVAFAMASHHVTKDNRPVSSASTYACLELPRP